MTAFVYFLQDKIMSRKRKTTSSTQEIHLNDVNGIWKELILSTGKLLVSVITKENLGHKPEIKQYRDYNLKKAHH